MAMHAHFDCFGGAAGDMMLAACIDAADSLPYPLELDHGQRLSTSTATITSHSADDSARAQGSNSERLLSRLIFDLENGLPELKGEFHLSSQRVWRSAGMIAARKVNVSSVYEHKAAPVPGAGGSSVQETNAMVKSEKNSAHQVDGGGVLNSHKHRHDHDHNHHQQQTHHDHSHDHHHNHDHNHNHQHHQTSSSELKVDPQTNTNDDNDNDDVTNVSNTNAHNDQSHNHEHSQNMADDHPSTTHRNHHHEHSHSHGHKHSHGHDHHHHHSNSCSSSGKLRNLPQISKMLSSSASSQFIPSPVARLAIDAFTALAHAEMHAHGSASIDDVHFHEVGAVDSIVDTVGTLLALYHLGVNLGGRGGQGKRRTTSEDGGVDDGNDNDGDQEDPTIAVTCSALPLGEGTVMTDHGLLPVPAPAALRLMIGMPTCPGPMGTTGELVTPTAAALLRVLTGVDSDANRTNPKVSSYWKPMHVPGRPPRMIVRAVGLGAGSKDFERHANVLRLILGETDNTRKQESARGGSSGISSSSDAILQPGEIADNGNSPIPIHDRSMPGNLQASGDVTNITTGALNDQITQPWDMHTLTHIEANIDDATPELLAHSLNLLLEHGAIDAWINPIVMKKGRPAHSLNCICRSDSAEHLDDEARLLNIMFRHTTTVGIRIHRNILRAALKRQFVEVQLPYTDNARCGRVDVKISSFNDGEIISVKPEFDHCKVVSEESGIPLKVVSHEAESMGGLMIGKYTS